MGCAALEEQTRCSEECARQNSSDLDLLSQSAPENTLPYKFFFGPNACWGELQKFSIKKKWGACPCVYIYIYI